MVRLVHDVLRALRRHWRRPAPALVIVLLLGIAIGINTSMFSLTNAIWFRPWSVPDVTNVRVIDPAVSLEEWRLWSERTRMFSALAATLGGSTPTTVNDVPAMYRLVSENYFEALHVPMQLGRAFSPRDPHDRAGDSIILGDDIWRTHFGSDSQVVGRSISLVAPGGRTGAVAFIVVGVAAPGFSGPEMHREDVWLPLGAVDRMRSTHIRSASPAPAVHVQAFGRLEPHVADRRAEAELADIVHSQRRPSDPAIHVEGTARFSAGVPAQARALWSALLLGVVFVTMIACANVSNLLLALGYARRGEFAIRLALGDRRSWIAARFLTESLLLSLVAGAIGLAIASWLPDALYKNVVESAGESLPIQLAFPVDWHVLAWALGAASITCIVFGLLPAWMCSDVNVREVLQREGGHMIARSGLIPSLLGWQTMVSVIAIGVAGLMLRSDSVTDARRLKRSFDAVSIVAVVPSRDADATERERTSQSIVTRLADAVGAAQVAGIVGAPLVGASQTLRVTATYFDVMRLRVGEGRTFSAADSLDAVVVLNTTAAARLWPQGPVRDRVVTAGSDLWDKSLIGRRVIGVVEDGPFSHPAAYVPVDAPSVRAFIVRAPQDRVGRSLEPPHGQFTSRPMVRIMKGSTWIASSIGPSLFAAWLVAAFGGTALVLGAVGLFSLLEYLAEQRTREMGVRRALGASNVQMMTSLLNPTLQPLLRGGVAGVIAIAAAGLFMARAEVPGGVHPLDLVTYLGVTGIVLLSGSLASFGPVRRVCGIEPNEALRDQ